MLFAVPFVIAFVNRVRAEYPKAPTAVWWVLSLATGQAVAFSVAYLSMLDGLLVPIPIVVFGGLLLGGGASGLVDLTQLLGVTVTNAQTVNAASPVVRRE